jgi:glycosyltransferase involved in cell wall biosynthesis
MALYGGSMKKSILLKGPLLTRSGYGEQARFALRALKSRQDLFDIFIQPINWGATSWMIENNEERDWIDQTIEKTIGYIQQGGKFDMSVQVTIPLEWENLATKNIGYTAGIETTQASHVWIEKGNHMHNIIVVSSHSKQTYADIHYDAMNTQTNEPVELKLTVPVSVANYPVKNYENIEELDLPLDYDFNFLAVAQFGPRKNLHNTIKWFVEEFYNDEVGLIVKSNIAKNCLMDRRRLSTDLQRMMQPYSDKKCKVYLIHGDMTDAEIHSLYAHSKVKAFLALPHGEGFGLPIFEAAYSGIPVVATGWSGQLDFLVDETGMEQFYNVAFDLNPVQDNVVWENVIIKDSRWAFPREQSAKQKMRLCYNQYTTDDTEATKVVDAIKYAEVLKERFSEEKMYANFIEGMGVNEGEFNVESWINSLDIEEIE